MSTANTTTTESLAFEGMLGLGSAILLMGLLAVAAGWFIWRERLVTGGRWSTLFWLLR